MVLDNCNVVKNQFTCKMDMYAIEDILTTEPVNFKLGNMNDNYGIIQFHLIYDITVTKNQQYGQTFSILIKDLIGNVAYSGSTVAYQAGNFMGNIKLSRYFNLNFTNGEQKCFFKKTNILKLICVIIGDGEIQLNKIEEPITLNFIKTTVIIPPVENTQKIFVSKIGTFVNYVYPNESNYNLGNSLTIRYITPSPEKIQNIKLNIDSSSFLECEDLIGMEKCTVPFEHFKKTEEESFKVNTSSYLNYLNGYSVIHEIDDIKVITP